MMIENDDGMVMMVVDEVGGGERVLWMARGNKPHQACTCLFVMRATYDRKAINVIFDSNPYTAAAGHGDY